MTKIHLLPCHDSEADAARVRSALDISRDEARRIGERTVRACDAGFYELADGRKVDWSRDVAAAIASKVSIAPDAPLPSPASAPFDELVVQVRNETTLETAARHAQHGLRSLALNFANGVHPGGGFLTGSRAQEEVLCRSSALYVTLRGDPMYAAHRRRPLPDSSDWVILSPDVPVFRTDDGRALPLPWRTSFLTCAAPYAPTVGVGQAAELMASRIRRVLAVARAYGFEALVLGAWGCGAFANDAERVADEFREAVLQDFLGGFREVVFAITDWSPERKFLAPFRVVLRTD